MAMDAFYIALLLLQIRSNQALGLRLVGTILHYTCLWVLRQLIVNAFTTFIDRP